jgi:hypothetical protein
MEDAPIVTERGYRDSCLGRVLQLKVYDRAYRPLSWRDAWEAFVARYPGRWAVQVFPPKDALIDGKAVYHLWVLEKEPEGLNLRC